MPSVAWVVTIRGWVKSILSVVVKIVSSPVVNDFMDALPVHSKEENTTFDMSVPIGRESRLHIVPLNWSIVIG